MHTSKKYKISKQNLSKRENEKVKGRLDSFDHGWIVLVLDKDSFDREWEEFSLQL